MRSIILREGLRAGILLAGFSLAFAVLGLTPSLSWIPEVPLLIMAALVPFFLLLYTGRRVGKGGSGPGSASLAGAVAGGIGGLTGGVGYLLYGKSAINVGVGIVVGIVSGALLGATGFHWGKSRQADKAGGGAP